MMETAEVFYTVRYTDNGEMVEKRIAVSAANVDIYQAYFAEAIARGRELEDYRTGRKQVITAFRVVRPEVAESKNATSTKGVL